MRRHTALGAASALSRFVGFVLRHWKLALVIAFFASPIGPHLRMTYTYQEGYGQRVYLDCTYLGSRGFIRPNPVAGCPVIAFLDARRWTP